MKKQRPRRKRMKRRDRLQVAIHWFSTYTGKNIIKGYRKMFGVDLLCAIQELKHLGIKLDEEYVTRALEGREQLIFDRKRKRAQKIKTSLLEILRDSNESFYYIVGYTSGRFPYGVTWEEAEKLRLQT